jgi:hypothetical protein
LFLLSVFIISWLLYAALGEGICWDWVGAAPWQLIWDCVIAKTFRKSSWKIHRLVQLRPAVGPKYIQHFTRNSKIYLFFVIIWLCFRCIFFHSYHFKSLIFHLMFVCKKSKKSHLFIQNKSLWKSQIITSTLNKVTTI